MHTLWSTNGNFRHWEAQRVMMRCGWRGTRWHGRTCAVCTEAGSVRARHAHGPATRTYVNCERRDARWYRWTSMLCAEDRSSMRMNAPGHSELVKGGRCDKCSILLSKPDFKARAQRSRPSIRLSRSITRYKAAGGREISGNSMEPAGETCSVYVCLSD